MWDGIHDWKAFLPDSVARVYCIQHSIHRNCDLFVFNIAQLNLWNENILGQRVLQSTYCIFYIAELS